MTMNMSQPLLGKGSFPASYGKRSAYTQKAAPTLVNSAARDMSNVRRSPGTEARQQAFATHCVATGPKPQSDLTHQPKP